MNIFNRKKYLSSFQVQVQIFCSLKTTGNFVFDSTPGIHIVYHNEFFGSTWNKLLLKIALIYLNIKLKIETVENKIKHSLKKVVDGQTIYALSLQYEHF